MATTLDRSVLALFNKTVPLIGGQPPWAGLLSPPSRGCLVEESRAGSALSVQRKSQPNSSFVLLLTDMADTIFTKIINGEIPAHFVYESDDMVGFLDIHPIQPGHTLLVPKKPYVQFTDMSTGDFENLMKAAHEFSRHMQHTLQCKRVVVRIEGFDVDHVHVHLIPCNEEHDSYKEGRDTIEPDHASLRDMAQKITYEK